MKLGEFELNNIYLADCYEAIKLIPNKSVDLIVTDPPYQLEHLAGGGMLNEKRISNLMCELDENELNEGIRDEILSEFLRVCKTPNIYIWCNKIMIPQLIDFFVIKSKCLFDLICWHKTNAMPLCGSKYLTDTEYCLYFKKDVRLNTVYETAKTHYELPINIGDKTKFGHPNCKPTQIIRNLIFNSSNKGDIVLDTFCGSGTIPAVCKDMERNYIAFDNKQKWVRIAQNRTNNIQADGQMTIFTM